MKTLLKCLTAFFVAFALMVLIFGSPLKHKGEIVSQEQANHNYELSKQLLLEQAKTQQQKEELERCYDGLTSPNKEIRLLNSKPLYNKIAKALVKYKIIDSNDTTRLEWWGKLLYFTCAVESHGGKYLTQLSGGPALGWYQIEPETHNDLYNHFFRYQSVAKSQILCSYNKFKKEEWNLKHNLEYQTVAAYFIYLRRLPYEIDYDNKSTETLAKIWKECFNTSRGKGTISGSIVKYNEFIK